ncbi:VUT family protein [Amycolatopsis lurida]
MVLAAYLGAVVLANWTSNRWPALPVGNLEIPAGTLAAGFTFVLRDLVHDRLGGRAALAAIVVGTAVSWLVASPRIAAASAAAFAVSEAADLAVYIGLRRRSRLVAMVASNLAGLVIDSLVFVPLAFGSWAAIEGQLAGKSAATVIAVTGVVVSRRSPWR